MRSPARWSASTSACALLLLLLGACRSAPPAVDATAEPIRLAVIVPLTGEFAEFGEQERRGVELAMERSFASGAPVAIRVADSQYDPEQAVLAYEAFQRKGLDVAYVASSGAALAVAPLAERDGVLLVSDAADARVAELCEHALLHGRDARDECERIVAHAVAGGARRLALLHVASEYGAAYPEPFRASAERNGATVAAVASFSAEERELAPVVAELLAARPDAVFFVGSGPSLALAIREAKQRAPGLAVYAAAPVAQGNAYGAAPEAVEGVLYADVWMDPANPMLETLALRHRVRFGEEPSPVVAQTFDAVRLALEALAAEDGDASRALRQLANRSPHAGATGTLTVHADGHVQFDLRILRVARGRPELVE